MTACVHLDGNLSVLGMSGERALLNLEPTATRNYRIGFVNLGEDENIDIVLSINCMLKKLMFYFLGFQPSFVLTSFF